jgi:hypothetical protein
VPVRQNVWTNRRADSERQFNWLNGTAGKRERCRYDNSSLIITTQEGKRSDDEQSSKICLLLKPGSHTDLSG